MSKTILVVDDEPEARRLLRTYFEKGGYEVVEAADGYDAVQKALETLPDLVIMDMAMPMMDGVNSTRTMRQHDELSETPILCLTAFGSFYDPRARDAGCNDVIHKPVDFGQLKPIVERYVC
jgi:CheY-like chemotaxis protein